MTTIMTTGDELKVRGQQAAIRRSGSAWLQHTLKDLKVWLAREYKAGWRRMTIDDFRMSGPLLEPASPNAWGSLPMAAVRAGFLRATGGVAYKAERAPAHSRRVLLWAICPKVVDA